MADRRRLVAVGATVAAVALLATACLPDTTTIDRRFTQAVAPATPPASGCAEVCGLAFRVTTITAADGERVEYDKRFGTATGTEIAPIASASKWLAATVVLSLVDDGSLSLSSTVGQFFPAYAGTSKGEITLAQLFSHTSGIAHVDHGCLGNSGYTLATCADAILSNDLEAPPGTQFAYGGNSMQVAGRMAELASGRPWTTLARERLTTPLGLTHTAWFGTNPQVAGGAVSTLADYDAFLSMIQQHGTRNGVRILSPEAVTAMETDRIHGLAVAYSPNPFIEGYGIGIWIQHDALGRYFTSPGLLGTFPLLAPGRCYRSVLFESSNYFTALSQMNTVKPEVDRQLQCR